MDADIYILAGKYGFKALHSRLIEIMRQEYTFLHSHFEQVSQVPQVPQVPQVTNPPVTLEKKKVVRKSKVKKVSLPVEVPQNDIVLLSTPETVEVKDVIVNLPEKQGFRDPKEIREFQKAGEEAKRKENEAAGVQVFQILTKDNLKKWIEDEGRTYAWVAREKAGCADTQVAATAQMMGIKSKISKKRGMIISGK